jgi:hypothetical protein
MDEDSGKGGSDDESTSGDDGDELQVNKALMTTSKRQKI